MEGENINLEIFSGSRAPEDFLDDLRVFNEYNLNLQKQVIKNTILWYPLKDIDEEWEKWLDKKTEKEQEKLKRSVKAILFITHTGVLERFSDDFFTEELKKVHFKPNLIKFFLKELNNNRDKLVNKIEKSDVNVIPKLSDFSWRIDFKKSSKYLKKIDEPCVILKISLSGSDKDKILFELSSDELKSFMRSLSLIKEEIELLE